MEIKSIVNNYRRIKMNIKQWFLNRKIKKEKLQIKNEISSKMGVVEPGSMAEIRLAYAEFYENECVQDDMILYEAYAGRGLVCSPYAIFKSFLSRSDFQEYEHVWVLENLEKQKNIVEQYEKYENVKFVQRDTLLYCQYLCKAKFLFNNLSFPNYYTKKTEQVYVNTWHGIPLKTLGFDIPDGRITGLNTIRNFLSVDVFLSPNRFMTERFWHAFALEGVFEGKVMESGMPRNDNFFHTDSGEIIRKLQDAGVEIDPGKKLIMYAPTWKGERYSAPDTSTKLYFELMERIEQCVNTEEYQVLVKPHQIVYKHIVDKGEQLTNKFIPASIDTNEILSVVDVLISDYSSIYFDFLASGRPIMFYIPDLQEYKDQRGLYFGIDKLPGPIAENLEQLGDMVGNIQESIAPYKEKYEQERQWACGMDDGTVCQRVIESIVKKQNFNDMLSCDFSSKKKLLLYSGALKGKKNKEALSDFLDGFDYDKFDVTLIVPHTEEEGIFDWIRNVDTRVRVLRRTGTHSATLDELVQLELWNKYSKKSSMQEREEYYPKKVYKRERMRILGQTHYDYAMDFSEKSEYYKNLFLCMPDTKIVSVKEFA